MIEKSLQLPRINHEDFQFPLKIFLATTLLVFIFLAILWFSFYFNYRISSKFSPLVDAAMEIKLEATTAHLLLEEIINDSETKTGSGSIKEVEQHLDNSMWYTTAMLAGGTNEEGSFSKIQDQDLRHVLTKIRSHISLFKEISLQRYRAYQHPEKDRPDWHQYHLIFNDFVKQADEVETQLQELIARDLFRYHIVQSLLLVLIILTSSTLFIILYHYEKRRVKNLATQQAALDQIKLLSGLLPICASCKNIRDDNGYWKQIETYIGEHSEANFTHGLCPECARKLYPDLYLDMVDTDDND